MSNETEFEIWAKENGFHLLAKGRQVVLRNQKEIYMTDLEEIWNAAYEAGYKSGHDKGLNQDLIDGLMDIREDFKD